MTPAKLERVASLMYGVTWQTYLAEALGVNRSTIWRWIQQDDVPEEYEEMVYILLAGHIKKLLREQ